MVSQTARMETLCALLGIGSIALAKNQRTLASGFCIGLSFLAHPFGVFYSIPLLYLAFTETENASTRMILKTAIGGILPVFFWGLYVLPNWDTFLLQFGAQLARKKELLENFQFFDKIRIFLFPYPFSYVKLLLAAMIPALSFFSLRNPFLQRYTSLYLVWFLSMVLGFYISSEAWYAIHILFPFYLLLFSVVADRGFSFQFATLKAKPEIIKTCISILILILCMYQIFAFIWYSLSHSYWENAKLKGDLFFEKIVAKAKPYEKIYLQLIPDPYFHLKEAYPEKQMLEFIPGELPIANHNLIDTWKTIDLYLFYDENLIHPSLAKYLQGNPEYKREEDSVSYRTKVPGKGDWRIISYERVRSIQK